MTAIDIEKTMTLHLMACDVPENAIEITRAQNKDLMVLKITAPHGSLTKKYTASQFVAEKIYTIVSEMVEIADWYHGVIVPDETPQTPWQRMWQDITGSWMATHWVFRATLTVVVIAAIAKLAGVYR